MMTQFLAMLIGDQCLDLLFDRFICHLGGIVRSFYPGQELGYIQVRPSPFNGMMFCYDEVFITGVSDTSIDFDCFSIVISDGVTATVHDSFDSPTGCHHCSVELKDIVEVEYRTTDDMIKDEIDIEDAFSL